MKDDIIVVILRSQREGVPCAWVGEGQGAYYCLFACSSSLRPSVFHLFAPHLNNGGGVWVCVCVFNELSSSPSHPAEPKSVFYLVDRRARPKMTAVGSRLVGCVALKVT